MHWENIGKTLGLHSPTHPPAHTLLPAKHTHFDLHHSFPFLSTFTVPHHFYIVAWATANQFAFVHLQAALVCKWKESICDTSRAARTAVPVTTGRWTQQRRSSRRSTPWQTEKGVPKSNFCLFFCRHVSLPLTVVCRPDCTCTHMLCCSGRTPPQCILSCPQQVSK